MRKDFIEALLKLRMLDVSVNDEFDRIYLMGEFAKLLDAKDELGEALLRYNKATNSPQKKT